MGPGPGGPGFGYATDLEAIESTKSKAWMGLKSRKHTIEGFGPSNCLRFHWLMNLTI